MTKLPNTKTEEVEQASKDISEDEYGKCPWCGEDELDFGIIGNNCNYCSYPDGDDNG